MSQTEFPSVLPVSGTCSCNSEWRNTVLTKTLLTKITMSLTCYFACLGTTIANEPVVLTKKTFHEQGGSGVATHTLLVPKGWSTDGVVWRAPRQFSSLSVPSQHIKVTNGEGLAVEIGPAITFVDFQPNREGLQIGMSRPAVMTNYNGAPVMHHPNSMEGWKRYYKDRVIAVDPDTSITEARVVDVFEIPELSATLKDTNAALRRVYRDNPDPNGNPEFNEVGLGFRVQFKKDGRMCERLHVMGISEVIRETQFGRFVGWSVSTNIIYSAPKGQLASQLPTLVTVSGSLRLTPQWQRTVNRAISDKYRGLTERARIVHEINMKTNRIISNMRNDSWQRNQRSQHESHRQFINGINEVEIYRQGGENYELPSSYNHVYGDGDGNFILTNDALYDPNTDSNLRGTWTTAKPKR